MIFYGQHFPCSGGKAAGHGLPTTVVDTEVPYAYPQAMAWSEAVERTQAAWATTVGQAISAVAWLSGLHLGSCWICLKLW